MARDDSRTSILLAAGRIFAEKGFQGTTIRQICEEAGVNIAAVNYHFGDKEHLYIEAVHRAHQPENGPEELLSWPEGTPPAIKLRDYIRSMLTRMLGKRAPWQRQLMMREMLDPTVACRELVQKYIRARFGQLQDILGEILPPETPEHRRQQIGFSIIGQALHYHVASEVVTLLVGEESHQDHYQLEALADHITEFSSAALGILPPMSKSLMGKNSVSSGKL